MDRFGIVGATLCLPEGLATGKALVVSDGRIESICDEVPQGIRVIEAAGQYLLPAFSDMHAHGMDLFEFTGGWFDPDQGAFEDDPSSWETGLPHYVKLLAATGVANVYLATWAAAPEHLARVFGYAREYMESDRNGVDGARVCGGNLEGTFINPEMCGAQSPEYIRPPDPATFDRINEAGIIRLVNVVPDFDEESMRLIDHVVNKGITPGAGHTAATGDQINEAVRHGLRYIVHFLNGPIAGSYKPFNGGGGVEAVLAQDDLYTELISDTYHVSPNYMREVIARKTPERVIAVTDQMFATRSTRVRIFQISGVEGEVAADGSHVFVRNKSGTLFSSTLTMDVACANHLSLLTREIPGVWRRTHPALSFEEALPVVSQLCSGNAQRLLGDEHGGTLRAGGCADLVLLDIEGPPGQYDVTVKMTIVGGRVVFEDERS